MMLVISRKIGESFLISDNMEVTVIDITGEKVVLGILAPRSIPISRLKAPEQSGLLRGKKSFWPQPRKPLSGQ